MSTEETPCYISIYCSVEWRTAAPTVRAPTVARWRATTRQAGELVRRTDYRANGETVNAQQNRVLFTNE